MQLKQEEEFDKIEIKQMLQSEKNQEILLKKQEDENAKKKAFKLLKRYEDILLKF